MTIYGRTTLGSIIKYDGVETLPEGIEEATSEDWDSQADVASAAVVDHEKWEQQRIKEFEKANAK